MNRELAQLILDTEQVILSALKLDGLDPVYKMLLECHEGVYDYIGTPHNKVVMQVPSYTPPLFTKNFGSIIFCERLFHPFITEKSKYKSVQLNLMQDSLLLLNEKIRMKYREHGKRDILIWYIKKINEWLIKLYNQIPITESHCVHTDHNDLHLIGQCEH
ncbi:MAG: hypothetical protein ACOVRN_01370 [Flavobacterium sp.]